MSVGYASKLSWREDLGGQLGTPELSEPSPTVLDDKIRQLADLVRQATRVVAFTGAGISTSCGIPDFRGPEGVWTLQRAKKPLPAPRTSFTHAIPSLTHQVLTGLVGSGKVTYIVSQNVDGLHLRSGVPRHQLAELHGNCFAERCPKCHKEYIRDFEMQTVGLRPTGRRCTQAGCSGRLRDNILDWEQALPEDELAASEEHASKADLAICLGTSLQITPACDIPLRTKQAGGHLVIVNLQRTPKDKHAALLVRAKCDYVMAGVMHYLQWSIPAFIRNDAILLRHTQPRPGKRPPRKDGEQIQFRVEASSVHGAKCPLPMITEAKLSFPDDPGLRGAALHQPPLSASRTAAAAGPCRIRCTLVLSPPPADQQPQAVNATVVLDYTAMLLSAAQFDEVTGGSQEAGPTSAVRLSKVDGQMVGEQLFHFQTQSREYIAIQGLTGAEEQLGGSAGTEGAECSRAGKRTKRSA